MTTPERWARIERLYHDTLARDGANERTMFLVGACAGDDMLRREVESLLAHDGGAAFLSTPVLPLGETEAVPAGYRLGTYVISEPLGRGGMGDVYRARDSRLGRDVAIKILPRALIADADRLARFEREARVLASLNHPHIGAIYGVEESAASAGSGPGFSALVLELIEGETLADKLARTADSGRGLPIPEVLAIARQVADALDAAHERGIIHRDLKPANIKITPAGTVKVLDFGLAKIIAGRVPGSDGAAAPIAAVGDTQSGMVLGTAAYMSPEQARGAVVDKRTDIWAFGCLLYEALANRPVFAGDTTSDTMVAVLTQEPDWTALPPATPSHLRRLLHRCLEKDPVRRQRDIGDVRVELAEHDETPVVDRAHRDPPHRWRRRPAIAATFGAVALVTAAAALGVFLRPDPASPTQLTPVRFSVFPPEGGRFFHNVATTFLALSPDGLQLAFVGSRASGPRQVWLRSMAGLDAKVVPGTEGALSVFWSPDSRSLAFFAGGQLKRIDLPGGAPVPLCDVAAIAAFGTWGREGTILFATFMGEAIYRVSSAGGTPEAVVRPDPSQEDAVVWPSYLPDGRRFLYLSQRTHVTGELMLGEVGHASRPILPVVSNAQWVDPDYVVFAQEGVLVAQRFDLASGHIVGSPVSIAEPVDRFLSTGRAMFTTSPTGTIAYHSYADVKRLVWIDRTGKDVGTVGAPGDYLNVRLSPGGDAVMFDRTKPGIGTWDVWTTDLSRGVETRLTSGPGSEAYPVWMPAGGAVMFADEKYANANLNLARKRLDTGAEDLLLPKGKWQRRPIDVSPDGRTLLYTERTAGGTIDIYALPLTGVDAPSLLFGSRFNEGSPRFSPDGHAIAFTSDESGRVEVYVAPYPPTGGKTPVSAGVYPGNDFQGGARWSADGRELFYVSADGRLMEVPVRTTPNLDVGSPRPLFTLSGRDWADFAVSKDGKRFLAIVPQAFAGERPVTVIVNWAAEVRR